MKLRPLSALLLLACACASEPGHGFSTLDSLSVSAELEPGRARDLGGAILTNRGYRVTVKDFELEIAEISLLTLSEGGPTSFDPANPPPGYSTCHGGHCHADSGELVDYADIEAELSGSTGTGFNPVATADLDASLDVLDAESTHVSMFEPSRELPEVELRKVDLIVRSVRIEATVVGSEDPDEVLEMSVDLPLAVTLDEGLALSIDREGPERLRFELRVRFDGTLFDGIEFSELSEDGFVELDDVDSTAGRALLKTISDADFSVKWSDERTK